MLMVNPAEADTVQPKLAEVLKSADYSAEVTSMEASARSITPSMIETLAQDLVRLCASSLMHSVILPCLLCCGVMCLSWQLDVIKQIDKGPADVPADVALPAVAGVASSYLVAPTVFVSLTTVLTACFLGLAIRHRAHQAIAQSPLSLLVVFSAGSVLSLFVLWMYWTVPAGDSQHCGTRFLLLDVGVMATYGAVIVRAYLCVLLSCPVLSCRCARITQ